MRIAKPGMESKLFDGAPRDPCHLPETRLDPPGASKKSCCISTTRRAGLKAMMKKRGLVKSLFFFFKLISRRYEKGKMQESTVGDVGEVR